MTPDEESVDVTNVHKCLRATDCRSQALVVANPMHNVADRKDRVVELQPSDDAAAVRVGNPHKVPDVDFPDARYCGMRDAHLQSIVYVDSSVDQELWLEQICF